jgi:guanylate kinase
MGTKRYFPIIISSPSGGGKSTICREIVKGNEDILYSISFTTRPPRSDEQDGVDYHFVDKKQFKKMRRRGEFLEWAKVHKHYYGTAKSFIEDALAQEKFIILDIDTEGTKKFLKNMPTAFTVFMFPPSMQELEHRLRMRNTDDEKVIQLRLKNARKEIADSWIYDIFVINDDIKNTVEKIVSEIRKRSISNDK